MQSVAKVTVGSEIPTKVSQGTRVFDFRYFRSLNAFTNIWRICCLLTPITYSLSHFTSCLMRFILSVERKCMCLMQWQPTFYTTVACNLNQASFTASPFFKSKTFRQQMNLLLDPMDLKLKCRKMKMSRQNVIYDGILFFWFLPSQLLSGELGQFT